MTNSFRDVYTFMPQYFSLLCKTQIEEIYADNNNFVEAFVNEEFFMLPSTLKVCDFANNRLLKFHFGMPYLLTLNLRNNLLGVYLSTKRYTNSSKTNLREVELSFNFIQNLSFTVLHGYVNTIKIILSNNKISDLKFDLSHLTSSEKLDLSCNNISGITSQKSMDTLHKISKTSKLKIYLSNNLLKCRCQNLHFLQWLEANFDMFINRNNYMFQFDNNDVVHLTNVQEIVKQLEKECSSFCITIGIITACIILAAGLMFRFRWRLRYLYYMTRHKYNVFKSIQSSDTYKYDAFIS
ncbi:unnamed protein product [Mytilus coruscus]|uniref:LRRCT domain-containing protein n=1 Tax=Mytilus coruscus TaxID=42192 RepID=A0A6J8EDB7_MYTCO|nr:unnamed protein product [Mytilus coruscus]